MVDKQIYDLFSGKHKVDILRIGNENEIIDQTTIESENFDYYPIYNGLTDRDDIISTYTAWDEITGINRPTNINYILLEFAQPDKISEEELEIEIANTYEISVNDIHVSALSIDEYQVGIGGEIIDLTEIPLKPLHLTYGVIITYVFYLFFFSDLVFREELKMLKKKFGTLGKKGGIIIRANLFVSIDYYSGYLGELFADSWNCNEPDSILPFTVGLGSTTGWSGTIF